MLLQRTLGQTQRRRMLDSLSLQSLTELKQHIYRIHSSSQAKVGYDREESQWMSSTSIDQEKFNMCQASIKWFMPSNPVMTKCNNTIIVECLQLKLNKEFMNLG